MKRILQLTAVVIVLCCVCVAYGATDTPESVDQAWKKAVLAGDIDAVLALYSTDAIGWFPDEKPAKGKEAIRESYNHFLGENTVSAVEFSNTQTQVCGDKAVAWGEFTMSLKPKAGGDATTFAGRFTELLKKEAGNWVYAVDHASADPSPTPAKQ
jgi:uncharacterized protein (TIGR02246 family)